MEFSEKEKQQNENPQNRREKNLYKMDRKTVTFGIGEKNTHPIKHPFCETKVK